MPPPALLTLPPEILGNVFDALVHAIGICAGVPLRRVCRDFDRLLMAAIYALPTFAHPDCDDNSPRHLTWEPRMGKALVEGLIRAKLQLPSHRDRVLPRAIHATVEHMRRHGDNPLTAETEEFYVGRLAHLAGCATPLSEILHGLTAPFPNPPATAATVNTIHMLLRYGADIRRGGLLRYAVARKDFASKLALIDQLLAGGLSINAFNSSNIALHSAAYQRGDDVDLVEYLLGRGADAYLRKTKTGRRHWSWRGGHGMKASWRCCRRRSDRLRRDPTDLGRSRASRHLRSCFSRLACLAWNNYVSGRISPSPGDVSRQCGCR